MSLDAVLKVGGSLSRGDGLENLCREISCLGERYRLLIVPGGGGFADQVRDAYRRFPLDETTAHNMALLAMDQFGYMIHALIPGSRLTAGLPAACRAAESGKAAVLLPSALVMQHNPLPHSWQVTSDTISAWIAQQANARRLVLLKSVDGLRSGDKESGAGSLMAEPAVHQLARCGAEVDEYLPRFLLSANLEAWVINGNYPDRLAGLLETGQTTGSRIRSS